MNCKPGDIAMVKSGKYFGWTVSIIKAAPIGVEFSLPNGVMAAAGPQERWIVESLSGLAPTECGRWASIGVARDEMLMPIGDINDVTQSLDVVVRCATE